jgi:transcriptional regulator of met regulon
VTSYGWVREPTRQNIYADQTGSSRDFLLKVTKACPVKIVKLLTDNGSQFTDRFTSKTKKNQATASTCLIAYATNWALSTA